MNHAFQQARTHPPQKKTSLWKFLEDTWALDHLIYTTRHRNNPKRKKSRDAATDSILGIAHFRW